MKAVVLRNHGSVENLTIETDYPRPEATSGKVVLKVRASSLNYHDIFTVRGMPGIKIPMPVVPGLDLAGEIVEVGPDTSGVKAGDRVLVNPLDSNFNLMGEVQDGGLAEYAVAEASQIIPLPDSVSFVEAAAMPVAYGTAHRMVVGKGAVKAGDKVLVLGASGGVGTAAVLLAKQLGAYVVAAVGSKEKGERLLAIGADDYFNYREVRIDQWTRENLGKPSRNSTETGFDVVINNTGGDTWHPTLKSTKLGGTILVAGATAGFDPAEDLRYIWSFELKIQGSNGFGREDIEALVELVDTRDFRPVIDSVLSLDEAPAAIQRLEERGVTGKVIIAPWGQEA
ncbi:zinc-binding dehydrogenase [Ancrocorticia populi]|uniref:Zinc-binding dehydrogenase n=2 Tax=Ancrocorticia populi TaxID=2175228 RepID=A0A2V1KE69_9ACTO|nr:zinc-binding dehydrogenase [Ancrocorticia populi]PWF27757.1 zinc-binding dehydrogenase [Ancrocorticia populi]